VRRRRAHGEREQGAEQAEQRDAARHLLRARERARRWERLGGRMDGCEKRGARGVHGRRAAAAAEARERARSRAMHTPAAGEAGCVWEMTAHGLVARPWRRRRRRRSLQQRC
jgi:hypothetical protein